MANSRDLLAAYLGKEVKDLLKNREFRTEIIKLIKSSTTVQTTTIP